MKQQQSLKNAIAQAKRNCGKYSRNENIMDAYYTHFLRKDELKPLVESFNKWARKNYEEEVDYEIIESLIG